MFNNLIIKVMKKILTFAAVTATALTACTKTETTAVSEGNLIKFDNAFVGNPTKAGLALENQFGASKLPDKFYVFGDYTDNSSATWLFNDVEVSNSNGSWTYSPVVAWEEVQAGNYKFVAYYSGETKNGTASFNFTDKSITIEGYNSNAENQTDLLLAVSDASLASNDPISFSFKHALSMIKFTLTSTIGDVGITDFQVTVPNTVGNVTMSDSDEITWKDQQTEANYVADEFTATTAGAESDEFVVIPQTGATIKIEFKANIGTVEKTLTSTISSQTFAPGMRYNYTAEITGADMDVIEFSEPTVEAWGGYNDNDAELTPKE